MQARIGSIRGEKRSVYRRELERLFPEITTALIVAAGGAAWMDLWLILLLPVMIRAALMGSIALHGLGHALAAGNAGSGQLLDYARCLPLSGLLPFGPIFIPGLSHPARAPHFSLSGLSPVRRRWIALSGPAANLVFLCTLASALAGLHALPNPLEWLLALIAAANVLILLTSWTD